MANQQMARRSLRGEFYDISNLRALSETLKPNYRIIKDEPSTHMVKF